MIWSVSTLLRSRGATSPVCVRKGSMLDLFLIVPLADIGEVAGYGGGSSHHGTDQVRSTATSLASFEIAIAGGGATLAWLQNVGVHTQAHGTARFPPLKAGIE